MVLLIAVIIVWGLVVMRFFSQGGEQDEPIRPIRITNGELAVPDKANYAYRLNYRDPFLNGYSGISEEEQEEQDNIPPRTNIPIQLPIVDLVGVIESDENTIALLKINETGHLLKSGDQVGEFKVLTIQKRLVELYYIPLDTNLLVSSSPINN